MMNVVMNKNDSCKQTLSFKHEIAWILKRKKLNRIHKNEQQEKVYDNFKNLVAKKL